MGTDTAPITEHGVATLPEQAWERARRRAEIIGPLAQSETVGHEAADVAAQALGLSRRQVYVLIRRARQGSGLVTDFARAIGSLPLMKRVRTRASGPSETWYKFFENNRLEIKS